MSTWAAILGTLGGVALGGGISWRIESVRWKRAEKTRWHEERRAVYAQFLQEADGLTNALVRISDALERYRETIDPMEQAVNQAETLARIQGELDIIGGQAVRNISRSLLSNVVNRIDLRAGLILEASSDAEAAQEMRDIIREHRAALEAFNAAAREDLGLPAGTRQTT